MAGLSRAPAAALALLSLLAGCKPPAASDTPLPTKERTVGRVQQPLQQADDDANKRREDIERAVR